MNVVYFCRRGEFIPTAVSVTSLIANSKQNTVLHIDIIASELDEREESLLLRLRKSNAEISVIHQSVSGSEGALWLKTAEPGELSGLDKIIYIENDVIIREDLSDLWNTELEGHTAAAVPDSACLYAGRECRDPEDGRFDSGVMLLDLAALRKSGSTENRTGGIWEGIKELPLRYSFPCVSLYENIGAYTMEELNVTFHTSYKTLEEAFDDAAAIHFRGEKKPWASDTVFGRNEWIRYYKTLNSEQKLYRIFESDGYRGYSPKVSLIIPVYNAAQYLRQLWDTVSGQSFRDFEVIWIDDSSTDESLQMLKGFLEQDSRMKVISLPVGEGASAARNRGLSFARGQYILFLDDDDYIRQDALEQLYKKSEERQLDLLLFGAETVFEDQNLENTFKSWDYSRREEFVSDDRISIASYCADNGVFKAPVFLKFIRHSLLTDAGIKMKENIIHADELFSVDLLCASRHGGITTGAYYYRRFRRNSIMTRGMSWKNCEGKFLVAVDLLRRLSEYSGDRGRSSLISIRMKICLTLARTCYQELSEPERSMVYTCLSKENRFLFDEMVKEPLRRKKEKEELLRKAEEVQKAQKKKDDEVREFREKNRQEKEELIRKNEELIQANEKLNRANEELILKNREEIKRIRSSWSYRIGRLITYLPGKMKRMLAGKSERKTDR